MEVHKKDMGEGGGDAGGGGGEMGGGGGEELEGVETAVALSQTIIGSRDVYEDDD